jgi:hypothetical protein
LEQYLLLLHSFLTKLTLNSIHGTDSLRKEMSTSLQHEHEGVVDEHAGHNHAPGEHVDHAQSSVEEVVEEVKSVGMKAVGVASEGLKSIETKVESITEEVKND